MDNITVCEHSCSAILDTGNSGINRPSAEIAIINEHIGVNNSNREVKVTKQCTIFFIINIFPFP